MSQPAGRSAEDGSLTLMLAAMFIALLALAGIVVDGGDKLSAAENATALAQEAARAGAGMVSPQTAYADGRFAVSQTAAIQAADQYLARAGYAHTSTVTADGNSIHVTVQITQPTKILSIIHIDHFTVTGTATARLAAGVTGPGR